MSNFRKILSQLAANKAYSWRYDGQDPTTEQEYQNVVWHSQDEKISWDEIQKELYKLNRKDEYPSIGDQLDALFHAGVFPEDMAAQIQAVKDKYPKA
jgi:hypothetical protein